MLGLVSVWPGARAEACLAPQPPAACQRSMVAKALAILPLGSNQHSSIELPSQAEAASMLNVGVATVERRVDASGECGEGSSDVRQGGGMRFPRVFKNDRMRTWRKTLNSPLTGHGFLRLFGANKGRHSGQWFWTA